MSFTGEQDGDICLDKGSSMWKCLRFDTTCYGWGWEGWGGENPEQSVPPLLGRADRTPPPPPPHGTWWAEPGSRGRCKRLLSPRGSARTSGPHLPCFLVALVGSSGSTGPRVLLVMGHGGK